MNKLVDQWDDWFVLGKYHVVYVTVAWRNTEDWIML